MKTLTWLPDETPEELNAALRVLSEEYPVTEKAGGEILHFRKGKSLSVEYTAEGVTVTADTTAAALRGTGLALAGVSADGESCPFSMFGVMIDCSRNAVMTVEFAKKVLRCLALSGYNTAMLYTEDTYQLPDEPHFGFLRGAYSMEEIRELDCYAASLGIELIGCIQTLGHLATFLRLAGASSVADTERILLAEEPETYSLIRKMLAFWSRACRSRRIHIGMDETHGLGRGKYMDRNGFRNSIDIYLKHLQRVTSLCKEFNLKPMMWSDMFFSMASKTGDCYDLSVKITDEVRNAVPPGTDLVYWDYDHETEDVYDKMISLHRSFNREPVMASGFWTWYRLTYDHHRSIRRIAPCIDSCRKNKLREFFFTVWGNDGAYFDFNSITGGLLWGADRAYGLTGDDSERLEKISQALHCRSYLQTLIASSMNWEPETRDNGIATPSVLLWDDPLLGYGWRSLKLDKPEIRKEMHDVLRNALEKLHEYPYAVAGGILLQKKLELQSELRDAYAAKDKAAISEIRNNDIPEIIRLYERFADEFRKQWLESNKPNGMETIQIRLGGLLARYKELAQRLGEWESGKIESIPELEIHVWDERCNPSAARYQNLAVSGVL